MVNALRGCSEVQPIPSDSDPLKILDQVKAEAVEQETFRADLHEKAAYLASQSCRVLRADLPSEFSHLAFRTSLARISTELRHNPTQAFINLYNKGADFIDFIDRSYPQERNSVAVVHFLQNKKNEFEQQASLLEKAIKDSPTHLSLRVELHRLSNQIKIIDHQLSTTELFQKSMVSAWSAYPKIALHLAKKANLQKIEELTPNFIKLADQLGVSLNLKDLSHHLSQAEQKAISIYTDKLDELKLYASIGDPEAFDTLPDDFIRPYAATLGLEDHLESRWNKLYSKANNIEADDILGKNRIEEQQLIAREHAEKGNRNQMRAHISLAVQEAKAVKQYDAALRKWERETERLCEEVLRAERKKKR